MEYSKRRTILVNSKRKRNKGSPKFEDVTYKNKGGIASLKKTDIVEILVDKYKHPNGNKLLKKGKKYLVERFQQVQRNIADNTYIPVPELDVVEEF